MAGLNANAWQVNDTPAALVGARATVAVEHLVDPAFPLEDLAARAGAPADAAEVDLV